MTIFETLGFGYVILSVGMFTALLLICSIFGATVAWKCLCKGTEALELDIRDGARFRDFFMSHKDAGRVG